MTWAEWGMAVSKSFKDGGRTLRSSGPALGQGERHVEGLSYEDGERVKVQRKRVRTA